MAAKTKQSARDKIDNKNNTCDNGNGSVVIQPENNAYYKPYKVLISLQGSRNDCAPSSNDATDSIRLQSTISEWIVRHGRKLAECLLVLSLPLRRAWNEDNDRMCKVGQLAVVTTVIYGLFYALLVRYPQFLQPPLSHWKVEDNNDTRKRNSNRDDLQTASRNFVPAWRSRILSIANALLLLVGSGLSFAEWNSNPESEGWVRSLPLETDTGTACSCFNSHAITFTYLFVGYLQWDLCWIVWHRDTHPDLGSIIHHGLFILMASCICDGTMIYFRKPVAWLTLTELSTPFLNLRWYLAATDQKDTKLYCGMSLVFAATFLSTRAVGYGLGLADVWQSLYYWVEYSRLVGIVAGLHLVYILNLVWSYKVCAAVVRAFRSTTNTATPRTKQE